MMKEFKNYVKWEEEMNILYAFVYRQRSQERLNLEHSGDVLVNFKDVSISSSCQVAALRNQFQSNFRNRITACTSK